MKRRTAIIIGAATAIALVIFITWLTRPTKPANQTLQRLQAEADRITMPAGAITRPDQFIDRQPGTCIDTACPSVRRVYQVRLAHGGSAILAGVGWS